MSRELNEKGFIEWISNYFPHYKNKTFLSVQNSHPTEAKAWLAACEFKDSIEKDLDKVINTCIVEMMESGVPSLAKKKAKEEWSNK